MEALFLLAGLYFLVAPVMGIIAFLALRRSGNEIRHLRARLTAVTEGLDNLTAAHTALRAELGLAPAQEAETPAPEPPEYSEPTEAEPTQAAAREAFERSLSDEPSEAPPAETPSPETAAAAGQARTAGPPDRRRFADLLQPHSGQSVRLHRCRRRRLASLL